MAKRVAVEFSKGRTLGIDVSKWQMGIDLKQVFESNASLQFCIARTGDGKDTDPTFKKFFQETEAHDGVIPGSYHYFRADRDGHSQASQCLNFSPAQDTSQVFTFLLQLTLRTEPV